MCPGRTSQVVGKEHPAEARVEWVREGVKSNQYWSAIGPVLVTPRISTGTNVYQYYFIFLFGEQRAASVAFGLCDSVLSSAAKAS